MKLTLPEPPSANRYWRVWRGRAVKSREAKDYQTLVRNLALAAGLRPTEGDKSLRILWYRRQKRGDLDNRLKVVLDALNGAAYHDDRQVSDLYAERLDVTDARRGTVEITVEAA